jgi:hypothetical protein
MPANRRGAVLYQVHVIKMTRLVAYRGYEHALADLVFTPEGIAQSSQCR